MMQALMTPDLTPSEGKVYAFMVGKANSARTLWPSLEDMHQDLDMPIRTIMGATRKLAGKGLIRIKQRKRDHLSNDYFILDPGERLWPPKKEAAPATLADNADVGPIDHPQKTAGDGPDKVQIEPRGHAENYTRDLPKTAGQESSNLDLSNQGGRSERSLKPPVYGGNGSLLSEGWQATAEDCAFAMALGFSSDETERMAHMFRDHYISRAARRRSWAATWRLWVQRETTFTKSRPAGAQRLNGANYLTRRMAELRAAEDGGVAWGGPHDIEGVQAT
jgi:hypothetical protein